MTDSEIRRKAVMLVELDRRLSAIILMRLPEINLYGLTTQLSVSNAEFAHYLAKPTEIPGQSLYAIFDVLGPEAYNDFHAANGLAYDAASTSPEFFARHSLH